MKYLTYLLLATFFIVSACRKKTEREVQNEIDSLSEAHCYNGILDVDELGEDCGGEQCEPCTANPAPCNNSDNELYIYEGFVYDSKTITSTEVDSTNSGGIVFYGYTDGSSSYYLRVSFPGKPDISKTYDGVNDGSFMESNEVYVYYNGSYDYKGTGDVYVSYENGAYTIESCDYSFSPYGQNAPSGTQWFKMTVEI